MYVMSSLLCHHYVCACVLYLVSDVHEFMSVQCILWSILSNPAYLKIEKVRKFFTCYIDNKWCKSVFFIYYRVLKQAIWSSSANITVQHIKDVSLSGLFLLDAAKKADELFGVNKPSTRHTVRDAQGDITKMWLTSLTTRLPIQEYSHFWWSWKQRDGLRNICPVSSTIWRGWICGSYNGWGWSILWALINSYILRTFWSLLVTLGRQNVSKG